MTGCDNGVAARLKRVCKHLTSIHCVAHRLALAVKNAADDLPAIKAADMLLSKVHNFFSKSTVNRYGKLRQWQTALHTPELQLLRYNEVSSGKQVIMFACIMPVTELLPCVTDTVAVTARSCDKPGENISCYFGSPSRRSSW